MLVDIYAEQIDDAGKKSCSEEIIRIIEQFQCPSPFPHPPSPSTKKRCGPRFSSEDMPIAV